MNRYYFSTWLVPGLPNAEVSVPKGIGVFGYECLKSQMLLMLRMIERNECWPDGFVDGDGI